MTIRYSKPKKLPGKTGFYSRTYDTLTQKQSWISCGTRNQRIALEWVNTRNMEEAMGTDRVKAAAISGLTFGEALGRWLEEREAKVCEKFHKELDCRARAFWLPTWSRRRLSDISREDLERYYRKRKAGRFPPAAAGKKPRRRPAPATLNGDLRDLKAFFNFARRARWIREDPSEGIDRFAGAMRKRVRSLTVEEEEDLLRCCREGSEVIARGKRNAGGRTGGKSGGEEESWRQKTPAPDHLFPAILADMYCGFRRRTLLGLCWKHVDLERALWNVPARLMKFPEDYCAPVPGVVVEELRAYRARLLEKHGPERVAPEATIFGLSSGSSISRAFRSAAKRAGLPSLTFHDLRRVILNALRRAGIGLDVALAVTAHRDLATVQRHYREVDRAEMRKAMEALERSRKAEPPPAPPGGQALDLMNPIG